MALTGRRYTAGEMKGWGVVNEVVEGEQGVVTRAIEVAREISGNSPDSVVVSKMGVDVGWDGSGVEEGTERILREGWRKMEGRENMREGVRAFVDKRGARWVDSKL